jgi:hypothetical protein
MAKITNKLLKEAIADAEAVRETAIANAKLVLEESMGPQIKDMIARRLRVEAEMEDTPDVEKHDEEMEEAKELPFEEAEAEGGKDMPADTSKIGTKPNAEPSADAFDSSEMDMSGEAPADSDDDWYDDWNESDFDLGEIIKELESDIAALKGKDAEDHGEEEDEEEEEEEGEEEELKEAKHEDEEEEKELKEGEEPTDDDEEIDLEEILRELDMADDEMAGGDEDEKEMMKQEIASLRNEIGQYREAFNMVRERLQEVSLLNAKLLFTNKLFRKEGLNNEQKVRIVESFDRATTVREVKLVYSALVENLSVAAKTFNASRRKVVAEGLASKATPSTAPKSKDVIVENTVAKRLQELAGII